MPTNSWFRLGGSRALAHRIANDVSKVELAAATVAPMLEVLRLGPFQELLVAIAGDALLAPLQEHRDDTVLVILK